MSTIARRAGVGVATLFRRFPTRDALVTEVFAEQIARCEALLEEAVDDPDPWNGFRRLLEFTCAEQLEDRGFTEAFLASFATEFDYRQRRKDAETAFGKLVRRAQEAGQLRRDFAHSDLVMILFANGGLRSAPPEHAHDLSRRLVAYLLQTFSTEPTPGSEPLPRASPLGLDSAQGRAGGATPGRFRRN
jgi:AcrR family transcriptional regulator